MMKFATIFSGESNNRSGNNFNNNGLRRLDQWWRVRPDPREGGDFAILFGWLKSKTSKDKTQETTAEEVTRSFVSPSQLWIGTLPDKETTRPTIPGFMRQETFVRVFIPVTGQAKPKEREDQP